MALDVTDQKLIKGIVFFAVLGLTVYFWPFEAPWPGLQTQTQKTDLTVQELRKVREKYIKQYPPVREAVWGSEDSEATSGATGTPTEERKKEYHHDVTNKHTLIQSYQASNRMDFAAWTEVPPEETLPGFYFAREFQKKRLVLNEECRRADVQLLDPEVGFGAYGGGTDMQLSRTRELLRELFIAEMIVKLCVRSKQQQEKAEKDAGKQREAFMRIVRIAPEKSYASGPFVRKLNPRYDPKETNPRSDKFNKHIVVSMSKFIQMYPVQIVLQCDPNSFMRFLYAVRQEQGQFLVIQNLDMISPLIRDSTADQSELERLQALVPEGDQEVNENRIWVRMSAAGMDFFDPAKGSLDAAKGAPSGTFAERKPKKDRTPVKAGGH